LPGDTRDSSSTGVPPYFSAPEVTLVQITVSICERKKASHLVVCVGFGKSRSHFLKLGAQVIVTLRRIVLHLPQALPLPQWLSSSRLELS